MKEKVYLYTCKDKRVRAIILQDGTRVQKSYPRILMEEKLGRPLEPYEDVHHIDGNTLNNDISNLEIKLHGKHQQEHSRKYFDKELECPQCHKKFIWSAKRQSTYYSNISRKNSHIKSNKHFLFKVLCRKVW